jgi:hypothetical protein
MTMMNTSNYAPFFALALALAVSAPLVAGTSIAGYKDLDDLSRAHAFYDAVEEGGLKGLEAHLKQEPWIPTLIRSVRWGRYAAFENLLTELFKQFDVLRQRILVKTILQAFESELGRDAEFASSTFKKHCKLAVVDALNKLKVPPTRGAANLSAAAHCYDEALVKELQAISSIKEAMRVLHRSHHMDFLDGVAKASGQDKRKLIDALIDDITAEQAAAMKTPFSPSAVMPAQIKLGATAAGMTTCF